MNRVQELFVQVKTVDGGTSWLRIGAISMVRPMVSYAGIADENGTRFAHVYMAGQREPLGVAMTVEEFFGLLHRTAEAGS